MGFSMFKRPVFRFGLFAVCIALGWFAADNSKGIAGSDKVISYDQGDLTMNGAQAEAQKHLPKFLEKILDDQGLAAEGAMVKVAFPISKNGQSGHEVIWVGPFGGVDGNFRGMLANRPRDMEAQVGDIVEFDTTMIRDWMFTGPDGKLYGSYTTRVMLPDMHPQTAAQLRAALSENPLPSDWN